jgi:hypothetical protein
VVGGWLGCSCCADFESELIDCAVMNCVDAMDSALGSSRSDAVSKSASPP